MEMAADMLAVVDEMNLHCQVSMDCVQCITV